MRVFYALGVVSWLLVVLGFSSTITTDPFFRWFVCPIVFFFTIYHLCSYGLCLFYRQHNLKKHRILTPSFWADRRAMSVDVFLPICGEDIAALRNTWHHISRLKYSNKRVYVLDDSRERCEEHKRMAEEYGFTYFERPNKGEMKKAGNLLHAYQQTGGEFITIFDADFAPHPDFLRELLPYMSNRKVGIVQSPQYFETTRELHRDSPLAYGAAHVQEAFYRFIQVARSRFGGTICCGSNAIYRRAALDEIGGTVQIEHSEDAHTGFALADRGWIVRYIPIILAVGTCPDNAHAYFHQQHRWCFGSMSLLSTKKFWRSPVSWKAKLCYVVGFLFYLHHPFAILFSFQLFWTLFFYNELISLTNAALFYPYLIWSFTYMLLFPISRFRLGCFSATFLQLYAYSHACIGALLSQKIGWIPTNAKFIGMSSHAFRQATRVVGIYVLVYLLLIALAVRTGTFHVINYNYYSIQFWMFYNLVLSGVLLWHLYRTMDQGQKIHASRMALAFWRVRTVGSYLMLTVGLFATIILI